MRPAPTPPPDDLDPSRGVLIAAITGLALYAIGWALWAFLS